MWMWQKKSAPPPHFLTQYTKECENQIQKATKKRPAFLILYIPTEFPIFTSTVVNIDALLEFILHMETNIKNTDIHNFNM